MLKEIDNDNKLVSIWLTKAESNDEKAQDSLKPLYKEYKAKKYIVAVFESGKEDLKYNTEGLLTHNKHELYKDCGDDENSA